MLKNQGEDSVESYRWAKAQYTEFERFVDIGRVVVQFLGSLMVDRAAWSYGQFSAPTDLQRRERRKHRAAWLRKALLSLGPTFIKVGQFFSTRADLVPVEYLEELAKLQDQVPAFSLDLVHQIIEREFGTPVMELFPGFEPVPIASASLGQVHLARLKSGEEVVVKVQRPGLAQLFAIDLGILERVARFVQTHTPLGGDQRDWISIHAECRRTLLLEIDYCNEGRNADTFRRKFAQDATVRVPKILWRYCSPAVLTMEYLPGIKISNFPALEAAGLDRREIARLGAQCYLRQVLRDGFFHADPHPGNLAVTPEGTLIFYDFGMMGQLPSGTTEKLMTTFAGIVQQDASLIVQSMVDLGALSTQVELGPVRRSVQYMLEHYLAQSLDTHPEISMAAINDDLYELSQDQPFRFPASFTFVLRSLVALEALGKMLDPEFNLMAAAEPLAEELMPGGQEAWSAQWTQRMLTATQTALDLPGRLHGLLDRVEEDDLILRLRLDEVEEPLLLLAYRRAGLSYLILSACFLGSGLQLQLSGWWTLSLVLWGLGAVSAIAWIQTWRSQLKS
ncbi:ABC1 kinase family protein [Lyngbya confervoides]|uniref:AarF/ABC1/UbiB kinase family protein n=1 Tax=Lyngbya confervoides BDU141951 TaxID=1574623 RepID=A0ABD4T435_9CYAN|nr:AarF/ABC1/UbiB kinase family protein [Lyngbya confervoides]MCM1983243.1 AarF/ABC1/UbiB kinase family protein [Lyngbya confervoides BDU141951]